MAAINVLAGWAIHSFPPGGSPKSHPSVPCQWRGKLRQVLACLLMDMKGESDEGKGSGVRVKDGSGIYSGAEGPSEDGPINWLLPVCQGKQPLITPAVVFMLLHASALHHPVAFALRNDQSPPLLSSLSLLLHHHHRHRHHPSLPLPLPPPFSHYFHSLFSLAK